MTDINFEKSIPKKVFKEELKKFIKIFLFLSLIILVAINWQIIKGMFNYKAIYGEIIDSLKKEEEKGVVFKAPETDEFPFTPLEKSSLTRFTEKSDSIEIPKIEVETPLVFIESKENRDYQAVLKKGAVHYSGSALPGENGQTIVLGHSAPSFWPKKNYNWIFRRLDRLEAGDEIIINYQNRQYRYLVYEKLFLNPGDEIPRGGLTNSENVLFLISCWPPETGQKRIVVQSRLAQQ